MQRQQILVLVSIAVAAAASGRAFADDPCLGFKWDVRKEHALFGASATALSAGKDLPSAPTIAIGRLYALQLVPQAGISFAAAPGKKSAPDGLYGGLAVFDVPAAGSYRISVSAPLWIDIIAGGKLAPVEDYQGLHTCDAPQKIVQFDLTGARHFVLQLSGAAQAAARLTVTQAPPRT